MGVTPPPPVAGPHLNACCRWGRGGGRRSAEVPIVGGRRVGADGEAGHSVWLSDALCQVPWGPRAFLSTLSSGPVCFPSVTEGSLSLPLLRLPGG